MKTTFPRLAGSVLALAAVGSAQAEPEVSLRQAFVKKTCPAELKAAASCYGGRDANGAWLVAAVPRAWNGILVVHAHGGPRLRTPKANDPDEDLLRFRAMVGTGYAWIGSTYSHGGYGVRMAAEDVDSARQAFWRHFGKPRLTILHGQSYGGNVAAKAAELHAVSPTGARNFDGVLITNGVLFGGTKAYGFRADLRAVYQYYCNNLPRPDETQYPLWQGLPPTSKPSRKEVETRLNQCTGADLAPARRTPEQARRLAAITAVTGIAAENIGRHLDWATFAFNDLVMRHLDGRNPFDNSATVYRGSTDDTALNRGVARFAADRSAVDRLAYDSDLTGLIIAPTITVHYKDDPVISAKADAAYAAKVAAADKSHLLMQFLAAEGTHSNLSVADYLTPLIGLVGWIERGTRPEPNGVIEVCQRMATTVRSRCTLHPS